ncbi:anosmin-1-like [Dendropsophus ebraccatus]|uniref:anosmin-1-like n=1 Tax=Dendropsophus ebraccatus TaxID=150705 RepID=UPI00383107BB
MTTLREVVRMMTLSESGGQWVAQELVTAAEQNSLSCSELTSWRIVLPLVAGWHLAPEAQPIGFEEFQAVHLRAKEHCRDTITCLDVSELASLSSGKEQPRQGMSPIKETTQARYPSTDSCFRVADRQRNTSMKQTCSGLAEFSVTLALPEAEKKSDPMPPAAPTGLRKYNLKVTHEGTVSVNIGWDVPPEHDLKINYYRICWKFKNTGKLHSERTEESCVLVDGAITEFTLQGLQSDNEYLVRIQAVSYWRERRMKSPKAQFIFTTARQDLKPASMNPAMNLCKRQNKSYKSSKNALKVFYFYHNNQFKIHLSWKQTSDNYVEPYTYLIKWRPVICGNNDTFSGGQAAVKGSSYNITGLQFACTYKVTVRPFTLQGPLVEEVTFVKTCKCNNMKAKSLKDAHCPKQGCHHLSRNVMHRSEKLRAVFQSGNGKIKGEFCWPFFSTKSCLFSWAEMSQSAAFYNTLTLPATHNFVIIDDLKPSTFYHFKVQTVGLNISSTEQIFLTPALGL